MILGNDEGPDLPSKCSGKQSHTQTSAFEVALKAEQSGVRIRRETNMG